MIVVKSEKRNDYVVLAVGLVSLLCTENFLSIKIVVSIVMLIWAFFSVLTKNQGKISKKYIIFASWYFLFVGMYFINGLFISKYNFGVETHLIYIICQLSIPIYYSGDYSSDDLVDIFKKGCHSACRISLIIIILAELPNFTTLEFRIGSTVANPNKIAMGLLMFFAVFFFERLFEQKSNLFDLASSLLFIILTGSKKGILGIIVIIAVLSVCKFKWKVYKYFAPCLVVILVYILIMNNDYLYSIMGRRIDAFFSDVQDTDKVTGSTVTRMSMYRDGLKFFMQSPIWGHGYNFFTDGTLYGTYSHSTYMELLVSFGLIGAGMFYSIYVWSLNMIIKVKNNWNILFFTILILHLVMQTAAVSYYGNGFEFVVIAFSVMCLSDERRERREC